MSTQDRTPRKYEAQIRHIVYTQGIDKLDNWVFEHGTENEWVWWMTRRNEMLTGERITNAVDIAALGFKETQAIRVAGLRLQAKLVKAFMETKPQQQKSLHPTHF